MVTTPRCRSVVWAWRSVFLIIIYIFFIQFECDPSPTPAGTLQVSCLGVERHGEEEDPRVLVLTSRRTDGSVVRFVMQAASPEKQQAWLGDVVQILESQRNFLNGRYYLALPCPPPLEEDNNNNNNNNNNNDNMFSSSPLSRYSC